MGVDRVGHDPFPHVDLDVVSNGVHVLLCLGGCELRFCHGDGVLLMRLGDTTGEARCVACTTIGPSVFKQEAIG